MTKIKDVHIKGVAGVVQVNEDGTLIKYKGCEVKTHLIKSAGQKKGYKACSIAGKSNYVHRIVAEAFVSNQKPLSYKLVLHKNGDTFDNHYSNLSWGDVNMVAQNMSHMYDDEGLLHKQYRGSSSIGYEDAIEIAQRLDNGEYASEICKEYNVSEMSIARIRKRYCENKNASPRYEKNIKETVLLLAQKYPASEVAKITGLKYHTVYRWVKSRESAEETSPQHKVRSSTPVVHVSTLPPKNS